MSKLTTTQPVAPGPDREGRGASQPALALIYSAHEPGRVGEVAWLADRTPQTLGRAPGLSFHRHRPGEHVETGPLEDGAISRQQLKLTALSPSRVAFERVGRLSIYVNGTPRDRGELSDGDVLEIGDRAAVLLHRRPVQMPDLGRPHAFGTADDQGIVGEGPASWALRARIRFVAERQPHALVHGPSGTGKELVARAIHALSQRSRGPLVCRSAATIPESLADAELFGNLRNYPNPGMADRPGLIGEANGGLLFLDEFGELTTELQARLLRVLDGGEYTRLGEARTRRADLRLVAATNRDLSHLKQDVLARLPLRIVTPALQSRREDIGLLVIHLLRSIAGADAAMARRLFDDSDPSGFPSITCRLVTTLTRHPFQTHVRELSMLLWDAISATPHGPVDLDPTYRERLAAPAEVQLGHVDPASLTPEVIQACLDKHGGRQEPAWRELRLSSRHALGRLVRRYGLRVRKRRARSDLQPPEAEE